MIHGLRLARRNQTNSNIFISLFLVAIGLRKYCRVSGESMQPTINNGDFLIYKSYRKEKDQIKKGQLIIIFHPINKEMLIVKRILSLSQEGLEVIGDNLSHSSDSRKFGVIDFSKIILETYEILYAGILSGGAAFVLQLFGQRHIPAAPAAIIMSMEGVFATISAWIILNQILGLDNLIGCFLILCGVLFSQLLPIFDNKSKNI